MIIIENTIISDDIITRKFCCDISKCHGQCCVEGDAGAPLEECELNELEKYYPEYKQYMTTEGHAAIEKIGFFDVDIDNEFTTPLINDSACVYAFMDNGILKCAIEKAYDEKLIPFKKPISCHLYPIRITPLKENIALNYHAWDICKDAITFGTKNNLPVYVYLKEPLIRKFGEEWYEVLCNSVSHL